MTLLSVGTVIRKTDLQSVHGGESKYEPSNQSGNIDHCAATHGLL